MYFCGKKKAPCWVLNWFCLICHILSQKKINYAMLCHSNLQFTSYNAYKSLEKTTNLKVKHIARSRLQGWTKGVNQTSGYITEAVPCLRNTNLKTKSNPTKTNPVTFHTPENNIFIGYAILFEHAVNLFLSEKS